MNAEGNRQTGDNTTQQDTTQQDTGRTAARAFPNMAMRSEENASASASSVSDVALLPVCAVVLICGILFAKKR